VIDCPEGKHRPDDRRQGNSRKIAGNYRWRADADGNFPQVKNGMRDEPQRRGGPQPNTALRSDHTDAESYAEKQLNNPNIADEVLIKETRVGHTWDELIPRQWSDEHKKSVCG
jgi:hypothetical protein